MGRTKGVKRSVNCGETDPPHERNDFFCRANPDEDHPEGLTPHGDSCEGGDVDGSDSPSSSSSSSASSSSSYEVYQPPEFRTLPRRDTRGRREKDLAGSEDDLDKEFWGNDVWQEESQDEEWSTEDESHYKDKFDSDFLDEEVDTHEAEDENKLERRAAAMDHKLNEKGRKKFDYQKVAENRAKRKRVAEGKQWSALSAPPKGKKARMWSQLDHMREAERMEKLRKTAAENDTATPHHPPAPVKAARRRNEVEDRTERLKPSEMEILISWSSDRKIEAEEQSKPLAQREREANEPPHERQLLFFVNLSDPKSSRIPDLYTNGSKRDTAQQ